MHVPMIHAKLAMAKWRRIDVRGDHHDSITVTSCWETGQCVIIVCLLALVLLGASLVCISKKVKSQAVFVCVFISLRVR